MSDLNSNSSEKKSYQPPLCTRKSISEIGARIRRKTLDLENTSETPNVVALPDVEVLIVEGYDGDLRFIRQTTRAPTGQSGLFWLSKGEGFVEMRFVGEQDAVSTETFLLFDLRHRRPDGGRILASAGGNPSLVKAVPHVILATSLEQVHNRLGIDPKQCWQLRKGSSPADLRNALRSFLQLSAKLETVSARSIGTVVSQN
jgi:hypothetical protein